MSYIGRGLQSGAFRQLDDISSGFDGSDTTHTMQVNSTNVTVGDVNQILLSLGGVIQKPGTDFTVSSSTLTFTTAPAANTSFFAILLGSDNGGTVTPTDGSVTSDKLVGNLVTPGTLDVNGQELILDADADTSITADTDDQVDIKIGGNDTIVVKTQGSTPLMQINAGASNNNLYIASTDATSGISLSDNGGSINLATTSSGAFRVMTGGDASSAADNSAISMLIDSTGAVTMPLQPAFHVHPASDQTNFNQGQTVAIVFGTERFDLNGDFASNTFTAPVTGKYRFDVSIRIKAMSTEDSATYYYWSLVTSNRSYYNLASVNELGSGSGSFTFSGSVLADMDASDTASVTIIMGGTSGSSPSDISADSYFSGNLVC